MAAGQLAKPRAIPRISREEEEGSQIIPMASRPGPQGAPASEDRKRRGSTVGHSSLALPVAGLNPTPPLSPASAAEAANTGAKGAAHFRPLIFDFILFMRLTWPFLSRRRLERVYETWNTSE
jgi:hypothetical protein